VPAPRRTKTKPLLSGIRFESLFELSESWFLWFYADCCTAAKPFKSNFAVIGADPHTEPEGFGEGFKLRICQHGGGESELRRWNGCRCHTGDWIASPSRFVDAQDFFLRQRRRQDGKLVHAAGKLG